MNEKKTEEAPAKKAGGKMSGHVKHKATRKAKCASYLTRATCVVCKLVFKSPTKRAAHVDSGHKSLIGVNKRRAAKAGALIL